MNDTLKRTAPVAVALFPGADVIVKALPVPSEYALLIRLPTALLCIAAVLILRKNRKKFGRMLTFTGIGALTAYLLVAALYLHSDPVKYFPGENSTVGLWLTDAGKAELAKAGSRERLHQQFAPAGWSILYDRTSQLATVVVMGVLYAGGFIALVIGLQRLLRT